MSNLAPREITIPGVELRPGGWRWQGELYSFGFSDWNSNFRTSRAQLSELFEPSIQATVDSIRINFIRRLAVNSVCAFRPSFEFLLIVLVQIVFLVGGFASSPWLSDQLERRLSDFGFKFCKPETHT